jgi:hypothetical protein
MLGDTGGHTGQPPTNNFPPSNVNGAEVKIPLATAIFLKIKLGGFGLINMLSTNAIKLEFKFCPLNSKTRRVE